ncbi:MAG: hypothetical protein ACT4OY_05310 [Alphaproteobacteria bacterium]
MMIDLGILGDGGLMLVCSEPLPDIVKRVEFYREQRLLNVIYFNEKEGSDLMHREVPINLAASVEKSPDVLIYSLFIDDEPVGYKAPLIQVGEDPLF